MGKTWKNCIVLFILQPPRQLFIISGNSKVIWPNLCFIQ